MFWELPASSAFGSSYIPQHESSYQLMLVESSVQGIIPTKRTQEILLMSLIGSLARLQTIHPVRQAEMKPRRLGTAVMMT